METAIRQVTMTAMLVGPNGEAATKVAQAFQTTRLRLVRVAHVPAACERLAVAMPQVVIVLGALHIDERDALTDRATAVGALVIHVNSAKLDAEALDDLVARAAEAALERKLLRDESGPAGSLADDDTDPR